MPRYLRRIIFAFFLIFFCIAAPTIVLYTAGFRYDFQEGLVTRTGVLSLATLPRGASISLDDVAVDEVTPYIFKHIIPGTYTLGFSKTDYHAWNDEVEIKEGLTTTIRDLLLFKQASPELLFQQDVSRVAPNADGSLVLYTVEEKNERALHLFETTTSKDTTLFTYPTTTDASEMTLDWSAGSSYFLFADLPAKKIAVYDASGTALSSLQEMEAPDYLSWHPSDDRILSAVHEDAIKQLDVSSRSGNKEVLVSAADSTQILLDASILSFVDNGTYTELRQQIGSTQTLIALLPRSAYTIALRQGNYLVLTNDNSGFILLDIAARQPILLEGRGTLFDWLAEESSLLWSDGYELNLYTPSSHTTTFLLRQSDAIEYLAWDPTGHAVLFATSSTLSAFDRAIHATNRQITTLLEGGNLERVWISESGKEGYFFGAINSVTGFYHLPLR
ncbi:MAG: PEGA domain-containing protein [Patescibacteria group bacterium]